MTYQEYRYWSIVLGCNAARLSMMDARGSEHFAIVRMDGSGKQNRLAREAAIEAITAHISCGEEPGEVDVTAALAAL